MYIKKITLFIIMVAGIICNNAYSILSTDLYKKKYSFSEPVLDEVKALNYIVGKGENPEVVFKLMWEEAIQKNENIQLKLLLLFSDARFYNKAKQRMPNLLNDNSEYSLNALIEMGVNQKKSWAFYEKAMIETNNKEKFILLNQANNYLLPQLSDSLLYKNIENEHKKLIENILTNVIRVEHTEKNKIKINRFINKIIEYKYSSFLFFIYSDLKNKKIKNPDYSFACLKAASELDYVKASVERGNIFHLQNNIEAAYECFLKAAKMGEIGSMYNVGVILAAKEAILDKQKGLKWLLKAADGGEIDAMYYAAIT
ncbi:MAG: hypothetical protein Q8K37_02675, partial [Alphaproteobacteria bacterium]|nr:hypothetical protein [Alphaproteobacteria bacterium]